MRRTLTVVAAGVVALVVAAAPAGAKLSKTAYFDVSIAATQQVSWTKDLTFRLCGDGIGVQTGHGSADLTFAIGSKHWVRAQRVPGPRLATLEFSGKLGPVQAIGTFTRLGEVHGQTTKEPSGYCPKPEPPQNDCGTFSLPADAQLGMSYISPATWTSWMYPGHPKTPSLVLTGPTSRSWATEPHKFCMGVSGDDLLGGPWGGNGYPAYAGPAQLPLAKLFGKSKHFAIHWHDYGKDDQFASMLSLPDPYLTASYPIETTVDWTVRFTRRAHPPRSG
jgi:hypothetical protein